MVNLDYWINLTNYSFGLIWKYEASDCDIMPLIPPPLEKKEPFLVKDKTPMASISNKTWVTLWLASFFFPNPAWFFPNGYIFFITHNPQLLEYVISFKKSKPPIIHPLFPTYFFCIFFAAKSDTTYIHYFLYAPT